METIRDEWTDLVHCLGAHVAQLGALRHARLVANVLQSGVCR